MTDQAKPADIASRSQDVPEGVTVCSFSTIIRRCWSR
jgi:hypothetical protein